jgi:hypothetical protein
MAASQYELDRLTAIVERNRLQQGDHAGNQRHDPRRTGVCATGSAGFLHDRYGMSGEAIADAVTVSTTRQELVLPTLFRMSMAVLVDVLAAPGPASWCGRARSTAGSLSPR